MSLAIVTDTFRLSRSRCVSHVSTISIQIFFVYCNFIAFHIFLSFAIFFRDLIMFGLSRSWCRYVLYITILFCDSVMLSLLPYWCIYVSSVPIFFCDLDLFRLSQSYFVIYIDLRCLCSSWLIRDRSNSFWQLPGYL